MSNDNADADPQRALQTALAKMESFKACEGLIRHQAELLNLSVDLHRRSMQFFTEDYVKAMHDIDPDAVGQLERFNNDVLAFMKRAQQGSIETVQELQAIVTQLTHEIKDAVPQS